jgi:hypothetical protein
MTTLTPAKPRTYMYILQMPWAQSELFATAEAWADTTVVCNVHWDFTSSSWVNGKIYPGAIVFKSSEDYMVFKLKFPQLIKF